MYIYLIFNYRCSSRVYDLAGNLVYDSGLVAGSTLSWDLLDMNGRPVANGVYLSLRHDGKGLQRTGDQERGAETGSAALRSRRPWALPNPIGTGAAGPLARQSIGRGMIARSHCEAPKVKIGPNCPTSAREGKRCR